MDINQIAESFGISNVISVTEINSGHINRTFRVVAGSGDFIMQNINSEAVRNPEIVMQNIIRVSEHLKKTGSSVIIPDYLKASDGKYLFCEEGRFWRVCRFIRNVQKTGSLYETGHYFGEFIRNLSSLPNCEIINPVPDFHSPCKYISYLKQVSCEFPVSEKVIEHIRYFTHKTCEKYTLPLNIVHSDVKADNILFDDNQQPKAIIDLDNLMCGYIMYDFGDGVRSMCTENNISISLSKLYDFSKGFLTPLRDVLTSYELKLFPESIFMIAFELGCRYCADYITGGKYFRNMSSVQILNRIRQLNLLCIDIDSKMTEISKIIT